MSGVLIVGAGPVGVLLSAELARLGVDASVLERRSLPGGGARAVGVHATALEVMERSGATERLLAVARRVREGEARSAGRTLGVVRFDRLGSRHPFVATLPQHTTEDALAATAAAWGADEPRRGITVRAVRSRGDELGEVEYASPSGEVHHERAMVVVVAGGTRSRDVSPVTGAAEVRDYPDRYLMTDVADTGVDGDRAVVHLDTAGVLESFPLPDARRRYVAWVPRGGPEEGPQAADRLREAVAARTGSDAAATPITAASAFGVRRSLVPAMRVGSVVAIGDAAHEVSPIGGQGMNLGLIDAVTLAPLLVRWVRDGSAPDADLKAWDARRRRAAALSARIAAVNTALGRRLGGFADVYRETTVRIALGTPMERVLARAYAMGFDPDAGGVRD